MREDYFNLIPRKNGYWYYYVYDKYGRRVYRSTGEKRKGKAMEIALQRARTGELVEPAIATHLKFEDYARNFWNYDTCPIIQDSILRGNHYSIQCAKKYASNLDRVLMKDFGHFYLEELTPSQIQMWLIKLPKRLEIAPKTANDSLLNLRQILAQAVKDNKLERNPCDGVKPLAKNQTGKGTFTKDQISKLFGTPWDNYSAYVACLLAAKTGMRMGEIRALTVEQIKDGYIDVNASWADAGEGRKTTKSGHSRIVPLDEQTIGMLRKVAPCPQGLVFTINGNTPVDKHFFGDCLKKHLKDSGIGNTDENGLPLTFHSFRYYFNSRLVVANMAGEKIRATIGHESSEMTQHYTRLSIEDMEQIRLIQREIC